MRVLNLTKYDNRMIETIMKAARVTDSGIIKTLTITVGKKAKCAHVLFYGETATIVLKSDSMDRITSLAHEIKHVAQISHGMDDFMQASCQTDKHEDRWHEIDAIEFSKRYA